MVKNKSVKVDFSVAARRKAPQNKQKQQKKRRPRARQSQAMSGGSIGSSELAQSMLDPFEYSSCIPDGATGVGCFTCREQGTITTGLAGSVGGIFVNANPSVLQYVDTANTTALNVVTGSWAASSSVVSIRNLYKTFRPVSMGLRVEYVGPTNTDSGTLYGLQTANDFTISVFNGLGPGAGANVSAYFQRYPIRNGCFISWRPQGHTDQADWQLMPAATSLVSVQQLTPIIGVLFDGAAASQSVLSFELVVNFEGQFLTQGFMPGGISTRVASMKTTPGWFEKMKMIVDKIKPIAPFIGGMIDVAVGTPGTFGSLGSLASGMPAPGRLSKSYYRS